VVCVYLIENTDAVTSCYEHGNEPSVSINGGKFIPKMRELLISQEEPHLTELVSFVYTAFILALQYIMEIRKEREPAGFSLQAFILN
jgi:hypothetical protein